ncbi:MAG: phosphate-starvation-inducible PsiE family protein [Candidatus Latescibacterota bacterium]
MIRFSELFERYIMFFTLILMMISIVFGTAELVWILVQEILHPPIMMLDIDRLLEFFGFFMMILIGLELMYSIKTYLKKEMIQVEIVLIVAIIAIARKIIILDARSLDGITLLGLGVLVVALAAGYYLMRKAGLIKPLNDTGAKEE